ncbi:MAG: hypothetical protein LBK41_05715 [Clostridiales bacterium]|jgi:hypothetical protein|nr:hypothetical protein [Clostridiales bacterium]
MAYETKVLLLSIYNYVKKLDKDDAQLETLAYIRQLANVEGVIVDAKDEKDAFL